MFSLPNAPLSPPESYWDQVYGPYPEEELPEDFDPSDSDDDYEVIYY